ncbi:MAG: MFS transporter [Dehalococcoidales bacterium]|nr:MFS transporter [Dehalococcoidales bacterium]
MVVQAISAAVRFSFGVLIDPLIEEYGWSRGAISLAYSLQFLVGIPAVLVAGRLAEKTDSRRIVIGGTIIFTVGMLLTATISEVWQFQFYYGVLAGGLGSSAFITVLPVLLTRWFHRKLGLAMGVMWVSVSLGPSVFMPLVRWSIEAMGWGDTFIIFGVVGGILMLASSFFLRDHPGEMGLTAYGSQDIETAQVNTGSGVAAFSWRQITVNSSFWFLIAVHALGCVGHSIPLAHMVSMATFVGIAGITAAGVLSVATAASLFSRLGMSFVAEAKGGRFTLALVLLLQTLPTMLLLNAREVPLFYSFALLFGLGYGGEMVGFPIFNRQYYGNNAPLNTIYSYQMAGAMLGMSVGGWLGGTLFDLTGVYTWSVLASVGASMLGMIAALMLPLHYAHPHSSDVA